MKTNGIFIYITCSSHQEGKKIAMHLLEKRLIACANMVPITSLYRWQGRVLDEQECVLIVKTLESLYDELVKEVSGIHSYTIACITKIPVHFNEMYFKWLHKEVER
ncbi:MAG: divalent-cation tolerance protein CutA [bacterium]